MAAGVESGNKAGRKKFSPATGSRGFRNTGNAGARPKSPGSLPARANPPTPVHSPTHPLAATGSGLPRQPCAIAPLHEFPTVSSLVHFQHMTPASGNRCLLYHLYTVLLKLGRAKPSHLCFLGAPFLLVANSASRFLAPRPRRAPGMCLDHCRVRVVGEMPRDADSGFSGGTRFCGTAGAPGLCRVEPEPRTTHRHQKIPADSGRSAIYRRRSRPHIANPEGGGHRGVKIHAALRAMPCRQGAGSSPTEGKSWAQGGRHITRTQAEIANPAQHQSCIV